MAELTIHDVPRVRDGLLRADASNKIARHMVEVCDIAIEQDADIRRLTDALREGLSDERRAECVAVALEHTTKVWDDQIDRTEAATIIEDEIGAIWMRALAKGERDG